jgi:NADH-quinone oxidoreductase subunit G
VSPEPATGTVTITVDGRQLAVPKGTTVYQAAKSAGIEIPIFCYHDRMPPLGACRMCLVRVEKMPKLQTSCTLAATDGMVVHTVAPEVEAGQRHILEFLLINHPLDCPICDKGGECPLQDQTFRWGPGSSRFVETKRDFAKPVSLGPVLELDRERCILCWRCVRFGEIIAGDDALKGFERGFASEVSTPFTLPVESKFIGNTIAICPVGALTSRSYRFRARPWDNEPVASTCTHCGLGCAVWLDVRGGEIQRTRAREERAVNDIWLCDLGFFGHGYVAAHDRLTAPLVRRNDHLEEATWDEALDVVAARLLEIRARDPRRVAFLGGRRLSNEDAFTAARLLKEVVGTPHVDHRVDAPPDAASLTVPWGLRAPIDEIGRGDVFVLIGCDLTEEYPVLWLRMKAAIDQGAALVSLHCKRLEIARHARHHLTVRYDHLSGAVDDLAGAMERGDAAGSPVAATVSAGARVHVFVGRLALDGPDGAALLRAAGRIAAARRGVVHVMRGKGNDVGAQRFGLTPAADGWHAPEILSRAAAGALDLLYVAGSDPATAATDRDAWDAARRGVGFVVVHEAFLTATARVADVVLPALVLPEKHGTVTNLEGRTLPINAAAQGPGLARADRDIFSALAGRLGVMFTYGTDDEVLADMRERAAARLEPGVLDPIPVVPVDTAGSARPARASATPALHTGPAGSLLLVVVEHLFTQGSMTGRCRGISDLAGVPHCLVHPDDARRLEVADRALVELTTDHGSVALQARLSDATVPGQVLAPRGYEHAPVQALVRWPHPAAWVQVRPLAPVGSGR